jgi:hypothetical protein
MKIVFHLFRRYAEIKVMGRELKTIKIVITNVEAENKN